jgi:hypothetical protein
VVVPVGAKQRHGEAPGFTGSGVPVAAAAVSSASGGAAAAAAGLTARRRPLSGSLTVPVSAGQVVALAGLARPGVAASAVVLAAPAVGRRIQADI